MGGAVFGFGGLARFAGVVALCAGAAGRLGAASDCPATLRVDACSPGRVLPNVQKTLTLWELNGNSFAKSRRNAEWDVLEFAEFVEVMGATGGSDSRDCLRSPADGTVLDDYDFSRLVSGCRNMVGLGLKPYLKLGNVPGKYSADRDQGDFNMNVRPPADYAAYGRYMTACAKALLDAFGREELLKWRFAVLTEFENAGWFKDSSGDPAKTFQAYCRLYEATAEAFTRTISPDVAIGVHAMAVTEGLWDERLFIRYAAEHGLPLKFVTASFYDARPGQFTSGMDLPRTIDHLRDAAAAAGLTNLWYGVDEGRLLWGMPRNGPGPNDLGIRIVGDTWQAAYDARIVKQLFDSGADYFASWGHFSGLDPFFDGLPSVSFHVARESAKFKGMRRVPVAFDGDARGGAEIGAVAAVSADCGMVRIMAYAFRNDLGASGGVPLRIVTRPPSGWGGRSVRIVRKVVDDDANWFDEWRQIRRERGIGDERFHWSPDDPAALHVQCGLRDERDREMFAKEIEPQLRSRARLKPVAENAFAGPDGNISISIALSVNTVAFFELEGPKDPQFAK